MSYTQRLPPFLQNEPKVPLWTKDKMRRVNELVSYIRTNPGQTSDQIEAAMTYEHSTLIGYCKDRKMLYLSYDDDKKPIWFVTDAHLINGTDKRDTLRAT